MAVATRVMARTLWRYTRYTHCRTDFIRAIVTGGRKQTCECRIRARRTKRMADESRHWNEILRSRDRNWLQSRKRDRASGGCGENRRRYKR